METEYEVRHENINIIETKIQVFKIKEERRMNEQEVTSKVDECIISVCNKVQNNELAPGEYADTVEALAALVEARTKLGLLFNGFA